MQTLQDGTRRADDGARSANASDLFAGGAISAGASSVAGRVAGTADHRAEHDEAARLRSGESPKARVRRCLTRGCTFGAARLLCRATAVRAQGGPPMITDDPGTPGNRTLGD